MTPEPATNATAPPLPMFSVPSDPDAWHDVRSPGGYEWWYFDALSNDGRTLLAVAFFDGLLVHPGYARRYRRFLRRPTRRSPPVASEYPAVWMAVFRDDRLMAQRLEVLDPGSLIASADRADVRAGENMLEKSAVGEYGLLLSLRLCASSPGVRARLRFIPIRCSRTLQMEALGGAGLSSGQWVISAPFCEVTGEIVVGDETNSFVGRGFHDHQFYTGPLDARLKYWMSGRVLAGEEVLGFQMVQRRRAPMEADIRAFKSDAAGLRPILQTVTSAPQAAHSFTSYPEALDIGEEFTLRNPTRLDSTPVHSLLKYEASWRGARADAICRVIYPYRISGLLGRLFERLLRSKPAGSTL